MRSFELHTTEIYRTGILSDQLWRLDFQLPRHAPLQYLLLLLYRRPVLEFSDMRLQSEPYFIGRLFVGTDMIQCTVSKGILAKRARRVPMNCPRLQVPCGCISNMLLSREDCIDQ